MFKIKKKLISKDKPPFIIAEMSGNHNGSLKTALRIVDLAAKVVWMQLNCKLTHQKQ